MVFRQPGYIQSGYRYLHFEDTPPAQLCQLFNIYISHKRHPNVLFLASKDQTDKALTWLEWWVEPNFRAVIRSLSEDNDDLFEHGSLIVLDDFNEQHNRYVATHLRRSRKLDSPVFAAMETLHGNISMSSLTQFDILAQVVVREPIDIIELHTYSLEEPIDLTKKPIEIIALCELHELTKEKASSLVQ